VNDFLGANYKVSEQWDRARPLCARANNALKRLVALDPADAKALRYLAWLQPALDAQRQHTGFPRQTSAMISQCSHRTGRNGPR